VGAILMIVLMIAVMAVAVVDSRDRVRRDAFADDSTLRSWYEARCARQGIVPSRESLQRSLRRAQNMRRWGPITLSGGTFIATLILLAFAASTVPGVESVWRSPKRLLDLIPSEALAQTMIVLLLIPVLIVEGILAALFVADLDINRYTRLIKLLD
jgi:hypothetical protein